MNQAPSLDAVAQVRRDDLPEGIRARLSELEALWGDGWRYHARPEGHRLDVPAQKLVFFPARSGQLSLLGALARFFGLPLPGLAGVALLLYAVWSMRSEVAPAAWWASAALLVVLGSVPMVSFVRWWLWGHYRREGLCLLLEGILRIREGGYQYVPRDEVVSLALSDGCSYAALCTGEAWTLVSGSPEAVRPRHQVFEAWLAAKLTYLALRERPDKGVVRPTWNSALRFVIGAAALAVFLWLTAVWPTASKPGQLASQFFAALQSGRLDDAYGMLAPAARDRVEGVAFADSLPDGFRDHVGVTINGVSVRTGTVVGADACVDGWLELSTGGKAQWRLDLVKTDAGLAIEDYTNASYCRRH
jgi:hypothetical protein